VETFAVVLAVVSGQQKWWLEQEVEMLQRDLEAPLTVGLSVLLLDTVLYVVWEPLTAGKLAAEVVVEVVKWFASSIAEKAMRGPCEATYLSHLSFEGWEERWICG
jgi:hypothetical protein